MITDKVKLVIWDMDETFWKGTLSEEGIHPIVENIEIVKELTSRGIVNSICSKNNFSDVKLELENQNIWEYFVFPKIDWTPKGEAVNSIINEMGLRASNVVFIDDNVGNIEEVKYFNPTIMTLFPDQTTTLLHSEYTKGKSDIEHSRLKQYKQLEDKIADKKESNYSNEEFLEQCRILVEMSNPKKKDLERINELIERTNQLNFTKNRTRVSLDELDSSLNSYSKVIRVSDKYGDYGLVGFVQVKNDEIVHFLFSCRTMNMRIENFVFKKIHKFSTKKFVQIPPELNLDTSFINENRSDISAKNIDGDNLGKGLLIGSCDLDQSVYYLNDNELLTEFNQVNKENLDVRKDHTQMILESIRGYNDIQLNSMKGYSFLPDDLTTNYLSENVQFVVLSALTDFSRGMYQHKHLKYTIAYELYTLDLTCEESLKLWPKNLEIKKDELHQKFKDDFTYIGPITPEKFQKNIEDLCDLLSPKPLIVINGAEIDKVWHDTRERSMYQRHKILNRVLDNVDRSNLRIIDVRNFVTSDQDLTDNPRHYQKKIYHLISNEIRKQVSDLVALREKSRLEKLSFLFRRVLRRIKGYTES